MKQLELNFHNKEKMWTDAEAMFADIRNHPHKVIQCDDPMHRMIGYKSVFTEEVWKIDLIYLLKHSLKGYFSNNIGKSIILEGLNKGK